MAEPVTPQQIAALIAEIEKLCRHIAALQRDVKVLGGRVIPYEDEDHSWTTQPAWDEYASKFARKQALTMAELTQLMRQADSQLRSAELDINFIRSRMDDEANSSEWKNWLRDEREGRERAPK